MMVEHINNEQAKPVTKAVPKKPLESKGKILVMDEEEAIRKLSIMRLSRLGYTSKACIDGAAAIKLYKNEMESGYPFDVVILDLTHNSGMGGVAAIKKLLKIDPDVKGIVSTGYDRLPAGINFKEYGFSGVLIKPYTMVELENILSKLIVGD